MLQTYVRYVHIFKVCKFFQTAILKLFWSHFAKTACKVANQNNFNYLKRILFSDKFSFQRCIICLCLWGCRAPPPSCILQKCVFMHGSVFLSSLLPVYSLSFSKPQSGNQKLNDPPSRKIAFLFNYLRGSNIFTCM